METQAAETQAAETQAIESHAWASVRVPRGDWKKYLTLLNEHTLLDQPNRIPTSRTWCATGHRTHHFLVHPQTKVKIFGDPDERLYNYCRLILESLPEQPELIYTGMALGFDTAVARACVNCRVPFVACVPCEGQELRWTYGQQELYHWLLGKASKVVVVSSGKCEPWKMYKRDRYMVDNTETTWAFWNGKETGGTAATVKYALHKERETWNCWKLWGETVYHPYR